MQSQADFFPLRVLYPSPSRPKMNLGRAQKIRKSDGCGFSALHRSSYAPSLSGHGKYSAAGAGGNGGVASRPMMEVLTQPSPKGNPMNEEQLSAEIESMLAIQTALITLVGALIRTHHDETNLQMSIVETLELSLNGSFALVLTEKQKTKVRDAVESLRSLHQRKPGVPIESRRF